MSGGFYPRGSPASGHYNHAVQANSYGIPSNMYNSASVNVSCDIPDQSVFTHDQSLLGNPTLPQQLHQKLDRLIGLVGEQKKEIAAVKSDVTGLKDNVEKLQSTVTTYTNLCKTSPGAKKLPKEMCVSVYDNMLLVIVQVL